VVDIGGSLGVIEIVVGLSILTKATRLGAYVAMVWLLCIAINLFMTGKYFDVAVHDVALAVAAFVLAKLTEIHEDAHAKARE
jgi:uncharacterized membrane protein